MKMRGQSGFTIVELIVVIIVIGVLATITSMMYNSSQQQAADVRIRDAADKFSDAIQLWSSYHGNAKPVGGYLAGGGQTLNAQGDNCTGGANGFQAYHAVEANAGYGCTVGDVMVSAGYLPVALFDDLPPNQTYANTKRYIFIIYPCTNNASNWVLNYYLSAPTASDTANYNQIHTQCATTAAYLSSFQTYGMKGATLIKFA